MKQKHLLLRQPDVHDRIVEFILHEAALCKEILDGDSVSPDTEVCWNGDWIRLGRYPGPPWLGELVQRLIEAVQAGDPVSSEQLADKILAYSAGEDCESVRLARFVLAHLCLCDGEYRQAVDWLEPVAHTPSRLSPAARNNLGVAWTWLRHPAAALEEFQAALAEDPSFLPARISLHNLVLTLLDERSPRLSGHGSWEEIATRESERLKKATPAEIRALLDPSRPFPGFALWHLFPRGRYFPGISSRLGPTREGQRAAARLLNEANHALSAGEPERARALAQAAPTFDPVVQPTAEALAATAGVRLEEARHLAQAERLIDRLSTFLLRLECLSLENLDEAREALALLAPLLPEEGLQHLYKQRIEQLVVAALDSGDKPKQSRLLTIARQFAVSESAEACRRAAEYCLADQALSLFWKAIQEGNVTAAAAALESAARLLGSDEPSLKDHRAILQSLQHAQGLHQASPQDAPP
jgi:hypothetical protein